MSLPTHLMIFAVVFSISIVPSLAAPSARLVPSARMAHTIPPELLALAAKHGRAEPAMQKKPQHTIPAELLALAAKHGQAEPAMQKKPKPMVKPEPAAGTAKGGQEKPATMAQPKHTIPPALLAAVAKHGQDLTSSFESVPVSGPMSGTGDSKKAQKMMEKETKKIQMQKKKMEEEKKKMQQLKKGMEAEKKTMQKLTTDMKKSQAKVQKMQQMKKKSETMTRKFLPRACNCRRGTRTNGVCYDFVRGHASYCRKRKCAPRYECVAIRTGIKCILRRTTRRVVPNGPGRCVSRKIYGFMYVPYSTY